MAHKKNDAAETTVVATPAPVLVEKRRSGLVTAGIIVGAVVVAGALFGGGVLVGTHIPTQSQSQFGPGQGGPRGGFQSGPNGNGGPGPVMPGQGNGQRDGQGQSDTDDN